MRRFFVVIATGLTMFAGANASAGTVWSQPGGAGGANSGGHFWISDNAGQQFMADNFNTTSSWTLDSAQWWGTSFSNTDPFLDLSSFLVMVFSDSGGLPGTLIGSTSIATGDITTVQDIPPDETHGRGFRYEAALPSWSIGPGNYWFAVSAEAVNPNGNAVWGWQGLIDGGDGIAFSSDQNSWNFFSDPTLVENMAWNLSGTNSPEGVPLPMPLFLGGVGLLFVMVPLRRRLMMQ